MDSAALPRTLALLILRATLTPSTNPRSSTVSLHTGFSTDSASGEAWPFFAFSLVSSTRRAGTASLRDWIRALRLVRYRRSIVVWLVLGRPITATVPPRDGSTDGLGSAPGDLRLWPVFVAGGGRGRRGIGSL